MERQKKFTTAARLSAAVVLLWGIIIPSLLPGKEAYRIYTSDGAPSCFNDMIKTLAGVDVVLFGELHGNPLVRWLQLETVITLHEAKRGRLVLGAEMLESDQQLIIDEYLGKKISGDSFLRDARLWPTHRRDYQALLECAREKGIPVIATAPPRRYSALVFTGGLEALDSLDGTARSFIAPLPIVLPAGHGPGKEGEGFSREWREIHMKGHWSEAQALKDATMAHFIARNRSTGVLFLHINGRYHSDFSRGIPRYLSLTGKTIRMASISTVVQDNIVRLADEHRGRGDFIICVPSTFAGGD